MNITAAVIELRVHHDSWIRQQIRDLVLHLEAPVETAELLQVALISLAQTTLRFEGLTDGADPVGESTFISVARQRIRDDLADEMRQMTHLSLAQRRRWTLVKLAREHVRIRLRELDQRRQPSLEEMAVVTGLSTTEIDALQRMANLVPWEPDASGHQLMELRAFKPVEAAQLSRARQDTRIVLDQIGPLLAGGPPDRLRWLHRQFGVSCWRGAEPLLPEAREVPRPPRLFDLLLQRLRPGSRLDRRPRIQPREEAPGPVGLLAPSATGSSAHLMSPPTWREEIWPRRMNHLLEPTYSAGTGRPPRTAPR